MPVTMTGLLLPPSPIRHAAMASPQPRNGVGRDRPHWAVCRGTTNGPIRCVIDPAIWGLDSVAPVTWRVPPCTLATVNAQQNNDRNNGAASSSRTTQRRPLKITRAAASKLYSGATSPLCSPIHLSRSPQCKGCARRPNRTGWRRGLTVGHASGSATGAHSGATHAMASPGARRGTPQICPVSFLSAATALPSLLSANASCGPSTPAPNAPSPTTGTKLRRGAPRKRDFLEVDISTHEPFQLPNPAWPVFNQGLERG